jgi:hypothetical protein
VNEEHRIERAMMRRQQRVIGWVVLAMLLLGVGALVARLWFPH